MKELVKKQYNIDKKKTNNKHYILVLIFGTLLGFLLSLIFQLSSIKLINIQYEIKKIYKNYLTNDNKYLINQYEYNKYISEIYPQELSQGRVSCNISTNLFPMQKYDIPILPFGTNLSFIMVADLDQYSRHPNEFLWYSYIKHGNLLYNRTKNDYTINWGSTIPIWTNVATNNRSIELSDITWFNSRFVTVCDYTGIVYTIRPIAGDIYPRYILADGDGKSTRTFKSEWMTVKDNLLYIGSHGKEWIKDGIIHNYGSEWIKTIDTSGRIQSHNWNNIYQRLRSISNSTYPGYITHEAVLWHVPLKRWFFLPRKLSNNIPFDDQVDEHMGTNIMFICDESFSNIIIKNVGPLESDWGFTSIARLPGSNNMIATKTKEVDVYVATKVTVFDPDGNILIDPPFVDAGNIKYEGIEFLGEFESL